MEVCLHIPHIPLNPAIIKIILVVRDEAQLNAINPCTPLFSYGYPPPYHEYTISDLLNKHLSLPVPDTAPFSDFLHTVLKAITGHPQDVAGRWLKNETGWLFQHQLQVRRVWYYAEDMDQFYALD